MVNDWFEWNGARCTVFGIHVSEQPPITIPAERVTHTNVPSRSGSLTTLEGDNIYDDLLLTANCFVADATRINEIAAWLKGSGTVAFANRQGGFYFARIVNQITFEKILRGNPHCTFAVNFRCKPFFYITPSAHIVLTEYSQAPYNPQRSPCACGTGAKTLLALCPPRAFIGHAFRLTRQPIGYGTRRISA